VIFVSITDRISITFAGVGLTLVGWCVMGYYAMLRHIVHITLESLDNGP